MLHDSLAMRGFGKMFKSFWHGQLENSNNIRRYMVHRGGNVEMPKLEVTKYTLI
jgi:hypothetical protein